MSFYSGFPVVSQIDQSDHILDVRTPASTCFHGLSDTVVAFSNTVDDIRTMPYDGEILIQSRYIDGMNS